MENKENKIDKAFTSIDSLIMKGVNAGVRFYNNTVGGNKVTLANGLLTLAPVVTSTGFFLMTHDSSCPTLLISAGGSAATVFTSHELMNENIKNDKQERRALERSSLDLDSENHKEFCGMGGYFAGGIGVILGSAALNNQDPKYQINSYGAFISSIGLALYSTALFIMRADYQPPRKNCIQRGIESYLALREMSKAKPARIPAR